MECFIFKYQELELFFQE